MRKRIQISFAIVFLILGIAVSIQLKSTQKNNVVLEAQSKSIQEVQGQLLREKQYSEGLQKQIDDYQKKVSNYEKNINVADIIKNELENARLLAGLTDVKGKGVIITIDDTNAANSIKGIVDDMNLSVITPSNILDLLNEIRAAGGQAISVNGERITSTTEVRQAGSFIRINNKNYNSPFSINVIGDSNVLESSLKIRDGVIDMLMLRKINVSIKQDNNVQIPKYKGIISTDLLNKQ